VQQQSVAKGFKRRSGWLAALLPAKSRKSLGGALVLILVVALLAGLAPLMLHFYADNARRSAASRRQQTGPIPPPRVHPAEP
jgi:hypothetical protein